MSAQGIAHADRPVRPRRILAAIVAVILGGAAALGAYEALASLDLGPSPQVAHASGASLAARQAQLNAMEASLHKALARKPPKLPRIPKYPPVRVAKPPQARVVQVAYVAAAATPRVQQTQSHAQQGYEDDDDHEENEHGGSGGSGGEDGDD